MSPLFPGVDLIEIERFRSVLDRHGQRFLNRVYTSREQDYCGGRVSELAVRFAGKEATMKALGTGVRGISWREIEILANAVVESKRRYAGKAADIPYIKLRVSKGPNILHADDGTDPQEGCQST